MNWAASKRLLPASHQQWGPRLQAAQRPPQGNARARRCRATSRGALPAVPQGQQVQQDLQQPDQQQQGQWPRADPPASRRALLAAASAAVALAALGTPPPRAAAAEEAAACEVTRAASGLPWCDLVVGEGPEPLKGAFYK
jgi:hypothetical protein